MLLYHQDMEDIMAEKKKQTLSYGLNKEYLKNCTIFGKAKMNVNEVKFFSVNNKAQEKFEDFELGM